MKAPPWYSALVRDEGVGAGSRPEYPSLVLVLKLKVHLRLTTHNDASALSSAYAMAYAILTQ